MKILNWILKAFDFIKESMEFIKTIAIIATVIFSFLSMRGCINEKQDKINVIKTLTSKVETFKTESNLNAALTDKWIIKYKDVKNLNHDLNGKNNRYLNEVAKAKETIKDLNIRLKDAQDYINTGIEASGEVKTEIIFLEAEKIDIKPIEQKHIKLNFVQKDTVLNIIYSYNAELSTVISRKAQSKKNGKDHFILPNAGWLWGFEYITTSVCNDPNAKITNLVEIEFKK